MAKNEKRKPQNEPLPVFHRKGEPQRLKIEGSWEDAAKRLLDPPVDPTPKRNVKPRKKRAN